MRYFWLQIVLILVCAGVHVALIVDEVRHNVSPWISIVALVSLSIWLCILCFAQIFVNRAQRRR